MSESVYKSKINFFNLKKRSKQFNISVNELFYLSVCNVLLKLSDNLIELIDSKNNDSENFSEFKKLKEEQKLFSENATLRDSLVFAFTVAGNKLTNKVKELSLYNNTQFLFYRKSLKEIREILTGNVSSKDSDRENVVLNSKNDVRKTINIKEDLNKESNKYKNNLIRILNSVSMEKIKKIFPIAQDMYKTLIFKYSQLQDEFTHLYLFQFLKRNLMRTDIAISNLPGMTSTISIGGCEVKEIEPFLFCQRPMYRMIILLLTYDNKLSFSINSTWETNQLKIFSEQLYKEFLEY